MRKAIFAGLVTLAFSATASAQRGGAMPAAAPVMRAPVAAPHAPVVGMKAPVAGNHIVSPRSSGAARPGAAHVGMTAARPGSRIPSAPAKPTLARKPGTPAGTFPINPIGPTPDGSHKPFIPGFLPPDAVTSGSCFGDCNPAPGFGFDFVHFFAVHPNFNKFQRNFAGVVIPGWGGGFYYPVPYYTEPQQAQVENEPAPAEQQESDAQAAAPAPEESAPAASRSNYAPVLPVEEYVFVKRDGTRIFAVAYSLSKDKVQYITKEGLRRTLSLDALDYDATMKSNEERGNTINLPGVPPAAMAMMR